MEQTVTRSRLYDYPAVPDDGGGDDDDDDDDDDEVNTDGVSSLKPMMNIADWDIGQWCGLLYVGKMYPGNNFSKTYSINPPIEVQR